MATVARTAWIEAWEGDLVPSAASQRSEARVSTRSRSTRYYGREATARVPRPSPGLERVGSLPKPRLVTRRRPQWPMIAAAVAFAALLLGVAVVSPMLLSSRTTEMESQVGHLENAEAQVTASVAALTSQIATLSAPERVAEQATQLGMQPAERVYYMESAQVETEGDTTVAGR